MRQHGKPPRRTPIVFYRTPAGSEVVRDWLQGLDQTDRNIIGQDLMRVQFRWPIGMPLCRTSNRIARVFLCLMQGELVALHGFIKKTQKTPDAELKLAPRRMREFKGKEIP
jgi:phage-related protein